MSPPLRDVRPEFGSTLGCGDTGEWLILAPKLATVTAFFPALPGLNVIPTEACVWARAHAPSPPLAVKSQYWRSHVPCDAPVFVVVTTPYEVSRPLHRHFALLISSSCPRYCAGTPVVPPVPFTSFTLKPKLTRPLPLSVYHPPPVADCPGSATISVASSNDELQFAVPAKSTRTS